MTNKRRRGTRSFWLDDLQRNRSARRLRRSAQQRPVPTPNTISNCRRTGIEEPVIANEATAEVGSGLSYHADLHVNPTQPQHVPPHTIPTVQLPYKSSVPELEQPELTAVIPRMHGREHDGSGVSADSIGDRDDAVPDLELDVYGEPADDDGEDDNDFETRTEIQPFNAEEGEHREITTVREVIPQNSGNGHLLESLVSNDGAPEGNSEDPPEDPGRPTDPQNGNGDGQTDTEDNGSNVTNIIAIEKSLRKDIQIWRHRLNLAAIVSVVGSVRYTVRQYEYTRDIIRDAGANPTWPSYATTQGYFQRIIETCMPKSEVLKLPKTSFVTRCTQSDEECESEADDESPDLESTQRSRTSQRRGIGSEKVRIFLPSAWAKLDVATPFVFDKMFPDFGNETYAPHPLEHSSIIRSKKSVTGVCNYVYADKNGCRSPCIAGTTITVSVQNLEPGFENTFQIDAAEEAYVLHATVVATWCVGSARRRNLSSQTALRNGNISTQERTVISSLSMASPPLPLEEGDITGIIPGDICTLLRSGQGDAEVVPVVAHRYWRYENGGIPSCVVIWVRVPEQTPDATASHLRPVEFLATHVVQSINTNGSEDDIPIGMNPDQGSRDEGLAHRAGSASRGLTADGTPFVVYRILLYCDDFQKSSAMFHNGSAGGCYFLPMSLPPEARRNTSSVRIISLTPPGVSTNQVLHFIVDDIVHASVHGVRGYTPTGQPVKIFIDVLGFVGDYPASSSVVDVVGHVGNSPCTVCSFRRSEDAAAEGSRYGYTTDVHANNSAFMRHGERHHSLRDSDITDDDANLLGMVAKEKYSDTTCPLLHLQHVMQTKKSRSALTIEGVPIVCNSFDAFRCNVIAPDHLLTGLTKDVLNAMFRSLPTKVLRKESDAYICCALRDNGLLRQKQVFNSKKNKLHSMTLSELFCVLLVSVPTFRYIVRRCPSGHVSHDCYRLMTKLQRLIALTYWWPLQGLDGKEAVKLVHKEKEEYFSDLKSMSKRYVADVDAVCKKSELVKKQLDKPNLHRIIELYEHTIPAFGHVREVMELVFESAHQPLKRCIARSNNHDAHVFAVEHCVGNDWQGRLATLIRSASHPDSNTNAAGRRGIRRMLLGEQADLLDDERDSAMCSEIDEVLGNLFTSAVRKQFERDSMVSNFCLGKDSMWKARVRKGCKYLCRPLNTTERNANEILQVSRQWIKALYPSVPDLDGTKSAGDEDISLFARVRRVKVSESGRQIGKPSGHDTLSANSCVRVYLDPSMESKKLLVSNPNAEGATAFFFAVVAFLQRKEETPFALCFKCTKSGGCIHLDDMADMDSFQLLRMTPGIRRIAIYHDCQGVSGNQNKCSWDEKTGVVVHTKSLLLGGRFHFQTRAHGYPPRIA